MTRRVVVVGFVLLVGLLVNLAYQPDVGTAADLYPAPGVVHPRWLLVDGTRFLGAVPAPVVPNDVSA